MFEYENLQQVPAMPVKVVEFPAAIAPAPAVAGRMVIARFRDGKMIKGTTHDFGPNKQFFHVYDGGDETTGAICVSMDSLKAVFFVKSYEGQKERDEAYDFQNVKGHGKKVAMMFDDGEIIAGYTMGYKADGQGFFLLPADPGSNNARVYILNQAIKKLHWF